MGKNEILLMKLKTLQNEIEKAKNDTNCTTVNYLENYKLQVERLISMLINGQLPESKGGLLGVMRYISEYDNLSSIKKLYDAAVDAELYYSIECKEWK